MPQTNYKIADIVELIWTDSSLKQNNYLDCIRAKIGTQHFINVRRRFKNAAVVYTTISECITNDLNK